MKARALMAESVGLATMQHLLGLLVRRTYAAALVVQWQSSKADTAAVDGTCRWVAGCPGRFPHDHVELAAELQVVDNALFKICCPNEGSGA